MNNPLKYYLGGIVCLPALPLLYYQGNKLKTTMPDLPEASGTEGTFHRGSNQTLKIIGLGESTMAGVGVETNEEGFMGEFARLMSEGFDANIQWKIYAKSGYVASQVSDELIPKITETTADLILVSLGGNDTFKLKNPNVWRKNIEKVIADIRNKFPQTPIAITNIPPIKDFISFTPIMKFVFGNLGEMLGNELADITRGKEKEGLYYRPGQMTLEGLKEKFNLDNNTSEFFSDGVHPSKLTYEILAKDLASFLVTNKNLRATFNRKAGVLDNE